MSAFMTSLCLNFSRAKHKIRTYALHKCTAYKYQQSQSPTLLENASVKPPLISKVFVI